MKEENEHHKMTMMKDEEDENRNGEVQQERDKLRRWDPCWGTGKRSNLGWPYVECELDDRKVED